MNTSFDPSTHTYCIDNRKVPGVTQVLRDVLPGWSASEWHMNRGTVVHACAVAIARNQDFDYDPAVDGQVIAIKRFFREVKPKVLSVESPVYSLLYLYGGMLDLRCEIKGKEMVLDWKATLSREVEWQLAGYAIPTNLNYGVGVEIHDDGTYRMGEVYDLKRAKNEWLAILTTYRIRRKCKIKEDENES